MAGILNNKQFLNIITESFNDFLLSGTSRSTAKLKKLHGAIANELNRRLGKGYEVWAQGFEKHDKETIIKGRYINKKVDITIKKNNEPIAGVGVKFVMQNYSQNSNNYFENMLGETANIRCNKYPYFQIFIVFDKLPYYDKKGTIKRWETFSEHNISKYTILSKDNPDIFYHTPNKTLIYVVHIPDKESLKTKEEYLNYYINNKFKLTVSSNNYVEFDSSVILNDIQSFMDKVYYTIMSL